MDMFYPKMIWNTLGAQYNDTGGPHYDCNQYISIFMILLMFFIYFLDGNPG